VRATLPEGALREHLGDTLTLYPPGAEPPEGRPNEGLAIVGKKVMGPTTTFERVPPGRYVAVCGADRAAVEVATGQTASVTLARPRPKGE
jgi:hypothetical protein